MATFPIREFGDPVLKERCAEVTEIDGALVRLALVYDIACALNHCSADLLI